MCCYIVGTRHSNAKWGHSGDWFTQNHSYMDTKKIKHCERNRIDPIITGLENWSTEKT